MDHTWGKNSSWVLILDFCPGAYQRTVFLCEDWIKSKKNNGTKLKFLLRILCFFCIIHAAIWEKSQKMDKNDAFWGIK